MLNSLLQSSHIVLHIDSNLKDPTEVLWLIATLQQHNWVQQIIYGGLPDNFGQSCQLHSIDLAHDYKFGFDYSTLNLLNDIQDLSIPLYGWGQNRLFGIDRIKTFQFQYHNTLALQNRLEHITKVINETGVEKLQQLFSAGHALSSITMLESQVNHDESAAFFCASHGTILIMPRLFHASKAFGVPPHIKNHSSSHNVKAVLFTPSTFESFYDPKEHFDYWLTPVPPNQP
ncbi:hypothetical protein ACH42_15795 [Endozoicomonas sp. (ex Bugula neritina AB1)]|nr:hypothetical protein ACH42_15795 [Endozoicomonas sp. (ex Bugula neritina AB1)]